MMYVIVVLLVVAICVSGQAILQGIPGDQSNCAVSDGNFIFLGTNTDPGKIVKIRISDMERVGEYIIPFSQRVTFLCPGTFDTTFQNLYFVGHLDSRSSSELVIFKIDSSLQNPSVTQFGAPADSFSSMFSDANNLYLTYGGQFGTQVARLRISDFLLDNIAPIDDGVAQFSGLVGDNAVFIGRTITRFSLSTFWNVDSRPIPTEITSVSAHTISGNYLFIASGDTIYRYQLDTLAASGQLPAFTPNTIQYLRIDPMSPSILHIVHRLPSSKDTTPYQYIRATVEPFSIIDASSFSISSSRLNKPYFIHAVKRDLYFHVVDTLDQHSYAETIIEKLSLDTLQEDIMRLRQGSGFLTRMDTAQGHLYMASSLSLIKRSVISNEYSHLDFPEALPITYNSRASGIVSNDSKYGYYGTLSGVIKIDLTNMTIADNKTVSFATGTGQWSDAGFTKDGNVYFHYLLRPGNAETSLIRYEYESDLATEPAPLNFNGSSFTLMYDSAIDPTGDYLYGGVQSGSDGSVWIVRFNFTTNTIDSATLLPNAYYVVSVAIDRKGAYLVVTTSGDAFKISTSDMSVIASLPSPGNRISVVLFDTANEYVYMATNNGAGGSASTIAKIELNSFAIKGSYSVGRVQGARGVFDTCSNTAYFAGGESFVAGYTEQPSNIAFFGVSGVCQTNTTSLTPNTLAKRARNN